MAGSIRVSTIKSAAASENVSQTVITSCNVPSNASNAILVVVTAVEHATEGVRPTPSSVTWGTDPLSQVTEAYIDDSGNAYSCTSTMWILSRPTLNQTKDVTVTWDSVAFRTSASFFVMEGLADTGAETYNSSSVEDQETLSCNVTTSTANAFVVDIITSGATGDPIPTASGQTERIDFTGNSHRHAVSDKQGPGTPGSTTMSWTGLDTNRQVMVVAAFAIYTAPPVGPYDGRDWISGETVYSANLRALDSGIWYNQRPRYQNTSRPVNSPGYGIQNWQSGDIFWETNIQDADDQVAVNKYWRYRNAPLASRGVDYTTRGWTSGNTLIWTRLRAMDSTTWENQYPRYQDIFFEDQICDLCGFPFTFGDNLILKVTKVEGDGVWARPIHMECIIINKEGEKQYRLAGQA